MRFCRVESGYPLYKGRALPKFNRKHLLQHFLGRVRNNLFAVDGDTLPPPTCIRLEEICKDNKIGSIARRLAEGERGIVINNKSNLLYFRIRWWMARPDQKNGDTEKNVSVPVQIEFK